IGQPRVAWRFPWQPFDERSQVVAQEPDESSMKRTRARRSMITGISQTEATHEPIQPDERISSSRLHGSGVGAYRPLPVRSFEDQPGKRGVNAPSAGFAKARSTRQDRRLWPGADDRGQPVSRHVENLLHRRSLNRGHPDVQTNLTNRTME